MRPPGWQPIISINSFIELIASGSECSRNGASARTFSPFIREIVLLDFFSFSNFFSWLFLFLNFCFCFS